MENNKVLDFTGVNHESNKKLLDDLTFNIAMIRPKEGYHINIPEELTENIAALKQRLELYQNFMDRQIEPEEESPLIALIVLNDASVLTIDIYSTGNIGTDEIVKMIEDAISENEDFINFGGTKINVNKIFQVEDGVTGEIFIINKDNQPKDNIISPETIPNMDDNKLRHVINFLIENVVNTVEDDDGQDVFISLLDDAIDELEQRFFNERYDKECVQNILDTFVIEYGLYRLFEKHIEDLKERQNDPNDKFEVAKELYGDLDQFMKDHSYLREKMED